MINKLIDAFKKAKSCGNLIHSITNPISINLCANTVLALGNKPIMAEHPNEVSDITKTSNALLVNLGNITDVRMKSIKASMKSAKKYSVPIVLDIVGIACSNLRKSYTKKLLKKYTPNVIKGNYSEIYALYENEYQTIGVDSENLDINDITRAMIYLANKYGCIVLASGKTDIIVSKEKTCFISNGTKQLSQITGTGCMLGSLVATFISASPAYIGTILACAVLGIAGEKAEAIGKNATFSVNLVDELSSFDIGELKEKIKMEEIRNEKY